MGSNPAGRATRHRAPLRSSGAYAAGAAYFCLMELSFQAMLDWVPGLRAALDIRETASELGVEENHLDELSEMTAADSTAATNPVLVGNAEVRQILDAAMARLASPPPRRDPNIRQERAESVPCKPRLVMTRFRKLSGFSAASQLPPCGVTRTLSKGGA